MPVTRKNKPKIKKDKGPTRKKKEEKKKKEEDKKKTQQNQSQTHSLPSADRGRSQGQNQHQNITVNILPKKSNKSTKHAPHHPPTHRPHFPPSYPSQINVNIPPPAPPPAPPQPVPAQPAPPIPQPNAPGAIPQPPRGQVLGGVNNDAARQQALQNLEQAALNRVPPPVPPPLPPRVPPPVPPPPSVSSLENMRLPVTASPASLSDDSKERKENALLLSPPPLPVRPKFIIKKPSGLFSTPSPSASPVVRSVSVPSPVDPSKIWDTDVLAPYRGRGEYSKLEGQTLFQLQQLASKWHVEIPKNALKSDIVSKIKKHDKFGPKK
jgi:hypothetical protein